MRLSFLLRPDPSPAVVPAWARPESGETLEALALRAGAALATLHPVAAGLRPEMRLDRDFAERLGALLTAGRSVLAAIAQPIARDVLSRAFGREVSRELIGRLRARDLIAPGPRSPRPGAPYTFVTTEAFLAAFDLRSLRDLSDAETLDETGLEAEV